MKLEVETIYLDVIYFGRVFSIILIIFFAIKNVVETQKIMLSFSRELNVRLRSIEANMAPPKNDLMSMRLSNYGPNVKQCQHPSKKRPKKLVTSLTCQVFSSVPPSHISHIFYYF